MAWKATLLGQLALAAAASGGETVLLETRSHTNASQVKTVTVIVHRSCGATLGFPTTMNYPTSECGITLCYTLYL